MTSSIMELLPDFPKGPLTPYRQKASFDWRKLKLEMEDEEYIRYKNMAWETIRKYDTLKDFAETLPVDEQRRLTQERLWILIEKISFDIVQTINKPHLQLAWMEAIFMYDLPAGMAYSVGYKMFAGVILNLGSERHQKFSKAIANNEILGCFALTEIAHGSNAKGMRTTATYDPATKEFIMHSADFEAAKCWAGLLGKRATHAAVFAKLITPDGKDNGLHIFIVPVRCPNSLLPYAGVVVGDMGEKMALNGMDNGFVMFDSYRIPAENLLNKLGDVDEMGNYISPIANPNQRFALTFSVLSMGRIQITGICASNLVKAVTIAVRYSVGRRQFGPENSTEEYPVLEYQQQQCRIMPYVAAAYCTRIFSNGFLENHTINEFGTQDPARYMEGHGMSSATKPVISWMARDGITVCREACGGHGYLKAAGFSELRAENDANCTYEGENSLLLQQASNYLLSLLKKVERGVEIPSPYGTVDFVRNYKEIIKQKLHMTSVADFTNVKNLLNCYKWLICFLLKQTNDKQNGLLGNGLDNTTARNNSQTYNANLLSVVYAEYTILKAACEFVSKMKDSSSREVVGKLCSLFGAWCLEKHLGTLYGGGLFAGSEMNLLREAVIQLSSAITPDSVSLVDTLAPPDFVLNSVLGKADGKIYQNLQSHFYSMNDAFSRPHWWKDILHSTNKSKL